MHIDIRDKHYQAKQEIIQALYEVVDPELNINIIDLGLVYDIQVEEPDKTILVNMTLSTPSCPMGGLISGHVKVAIDTIMPDYHTTVTIVWEPRWNVDKISERGKELLGW